MMQGKPLESRPLQIPAHSASIVPGGPPVPIGAPKLPPAPPPRRPPPEFAPVAPKPVGAPPAAAISSDDAADHRSIAEAFKAGGTLGPPTPPGQGQGTAAELLSGLLGASSSRGALPPPPAGQPRTGQASSGNAIPALLSPRKPTGYSAAPGGAPGTPGDAAELAELLRGQCERFNSEILRPLKLKEFPVPPQASADAYQALFQAQQRLLYSITTSQWIIDLYDKLIQGTAASLSAYGMPEARGMFASYKQNMHVQYSLRVVSIRYGASLQHMLGPELILLLYPFFAIAEMLYARMMPALLVDTADNKGYSPEDFGLDHKKRGL